MATGGVASFEAITLRAVERPFVLKMPPIAQTDDKQVF